MLTEVLQERSRARDIHQSALRHFLASGRNTLIIDVHRRENDQAGSASASVSDLLLTINGWSCG